MIDKRAVTESTLRIGQLFKFYPLLPRYPILHAHATPRVPRVQPQPDEGLRQVLPQHPTGQNPAQPLPHPLSRPMPPFECGEREGTAPALQVFFFRFGVQ